MKNYLILLAAVTCFLPLSPAFGQRPDYAEEAKELVRILKMEDKSSNVFTNALQRAITSYHLYHSYASEETQQELFDILFDATHQFKDEYYSFMIHGRKSFLPKELQKIKQEFTTMLDTSHALFCDIVLFYRLYEYKAIILGKCFPSLTADLKNAFKQGNIISTGLLEKAGVVASLIGPEDKAIEDSLINLVNEMYRIAQNTPDIGNGKKRRYEMLFGQIIPFVFARIKSKRSVENTIHLILDDFEVFQCDDCAVNTSRWDYIDAVVLPKLSAYEFETELKFYEVFDGSPKEKQAFCKWLYNRVKNREIIWKKTLIDLN